MESRKDVSLAVDKLLVPAAQAAWPVAEATDRKLEVAVLFTTASATIDALKRAGILAARLCASITLVVPQVVPYPLPLASPPVLLDFNERRFRVIAEAAAVETSVRIYLCRDKYETLEMVLPPRSIVVMCAEKKWWPTADQRLAGRLKRAGHEVILSKPE